MAEITWTEEAQHWLEDIYAYIAADNPSAAARTVQGIYDRAQDLSQSPELGYRYNGNLDILGVFHGALDISRYRL